jgi:hypothetical protein
VILLWQLLLIGKRTYGNYIAIHISIGATAVALVLAMGGAMACRIALVSVAIE